MSLFSKIKAKFDSMFIPHQDVVDVSLLSFLKAWANGLFDKKIFLGYNVDTGEFWVENMKDNPHVLIVGSTGTGKSGSGSTIVALWTLINAHRTVIILNDVKKGADDYKGIKHLPNVYEATQTAGARLGVPPEEMIRRGIDLAFAEIEHRQNKFNERGANDIDSYEAITGEEVSRILLVYEEFHAIPEKVLNFSKEYQIPHTPAAKFFDIMRIGRSAGVYVVAISQSALKSDFPPEIVSNFMNRIFFKVRASESTYIFQDLRAAILNSNIKGRGESANHPVHVPYMDSTKQGELIRYYVDDTLGCTAKNFFLTHEIIEKYLGGESPKDLYKIRKKKEIAESISNLDGQAVISVLHEFMGHEFEEVDPNKNIQSYCGLGIDEQSRRFAVSYCNFKLKHKHVDAMRDAVKELKLSYGIIYCTEETVSSSVLSHALRDEKSKVKILDAGDIVKIATLIDNGESGKASDLIDSIANKNEKEREEDEDPFYDEEENGFFGYQSEPPQRTKSVKEKIETGFNPNFEVKVGEIKKTTKRGVTSTKELSDHINENTVVDHDKKKIVVKKKESQTELTSDDFNKSLRRSSKKIITERQKRADKDPNSHGQIRTEDIEEFLKDFGND
ncbi:FtsK/SpoIIIE domain-containing protein [Bdellovibrio sp. BCCA]|uniref:FtsK/SpoIIIE domain-containing protein n=1 Tax=Bdellovibrio sp. BCCA TaxID=3136281 RepID=UPI0030F289E7